VPSLASIEEMREPASEIDKEDKTSENRLKWTLTKSKIDPASESLTYA
jgi:hypothetical protein